MSFAAVAWLLGECEVRGTPGWVLFSLCHACDGDGLAALSKRTMAREARMSEPSISSAMAWLTEHQIVADVDARDAPDWWLSIRADRRPRLVRLIAFTGSRFGPPPVDAPPVETVDDAATGSGRGQADGVNGVKTGSTLTPCDQPVRDASLDPEMNTDRAVSSAGVDERVSTARVNDPQWRPPGPATRPPVGFGMPARRGES